MEKQELNGAQPVCEKPGKFSRCAPFYSCFSIHDLEMAKKNRDENTNGCFTLNSCI